MTTDEILTYLQENASETFKKNIIKLGIPAENTFGVPTPELRKLAKKIPKDKDFLIDLWQTNYHECKILAILAMKPTDCGNREVHLFMEGIHSWDLCDLFCKNILIKKPNFDEDLKKWIDSDELFYKRAALTLIASTSTHASLSVEEIQEYLALIDRYSDDDRLLVKKAASWALRELGKTNEVAKELSIATATNMKQQDSKAKQWVAQDALKELNILVKVSGRTRLISSKSKMGKQAQKSVEA